MEPLYRRNQDGMLAEVVPQAQGKAAALSSYLARGGTPFRKSGRFNKGPMKGKNVDEATAEFERMWASAPDALKQKYANRTSGKMTDLAPSERQTVATPAVPKDMSAAGIQKRRMAAHGFKLDVNGEAVPINHAVTPVQAKAEADFRGLTAVPAGGVQMVGDANPDGTSKSAIERQFPSLAGVEAADELAVAASERKRLGLADPEDRAYQTEFEKKKYGVINNAPKYTEADKAAARGPLVANQSVASPQAPVAVPAASVSPPSRFNRATGLPFGYRPGDSVAPEFKAAADESVARQASAPSLVPRAVSAPAALSQSGINRPRTTTEGVEGRAAAEMRRQAGINANPRADVDDPSKVFTGRTLPLDQLVKRQQLSTSMVQPPRAKPVGTARR